MRFSLFSPASVLVAAAAQSALASTIVESRANSNNNGATDVQVRDGNRTVSMPVPLQAVQGVDSGVAISPDAELRILCIGDSITVGAGSSHKDGYREQLREHLSGDEVVFAGTQRGGNMDDGYYAAWSGKTIQYMSDNIGPSLAQRPNIVLVHAGTNDMNPRSQVSTEGSDPKAAADRLGELIDQIVEACPDAVVMVAVIVNSCSTGQRDNVAQFQNLTSGVVRERLQEGKHVLAVDFAELGDEVLSGDCVHPNDAGYSKMAYQWYNAMTQIPGSWVKGPVGSDPERKEVESTGIVDDDNDDAENAAARVGGGASFWAPVAVTAATLMMAWR